LRDAETLYLPDTDPEEFARLTPEELAALLSRPRRGTQVRLPVDAVQAGKRLDLPELLPQAFRERSR
jgi:hypothetical protein